MSFFGIWSASITSHSAGVWCFQQSGWNPQGSWIQRPCGGWASTHSRWCAFYCVYECFIRHALERRARVLTGIKQGGTAQGKGDVLYIISKDSP